MIEEYFGVLTSGNELKFHDVKNECVEQSWVPLCSRIDKDTGVSEILLFKSLSTARSFVKRNYDKNELIGVVKMPSVQIEQFHRSNIKFEVLDWPSSYKTSTKFTLGLEVVNLVENPSLKINYRKI